MTEPRHRAERFLTEAQLDIARRLAECLHIEADHAKGGMR